MTDYLINLPWSTVLFNILSMCDIKDLFNLRCLSNNYMLLVHFYLNKCKKVRLRSNLINNKDSFNILATNCYSIRFLNISKCLNLDKHESILTLLIGNNKHLTELNLSYCNSITSKSMQYIIVNCKELNTILLAGCSWFSTGMLDSLTYHQWKLHTADFSRCVNLSEISIIKFIIKFPNLRYLSIAFINSVTEKVLNALNIHCSKLEHLIISNNQFSRNTISVYSNLCPKIMVMY